MTERGSERADAGRWARTLSVLALVLAPFTALALYAGAMATGGGHGNYTLFFLAFGLFVANLGLFLASIFFAVIHRFRSGRYTAWGLVSLVVLVVVAWLLIRYW
jgi:hypothetical protein